MAAPKSMTVKIIGIKAVRVVPFGQQTAEVFKAGKEVTLQQEDAKYLIQLGRAEAVKQPGSGQDVKK